MLNFRDIKLEDKDKARELLSYSDFRGCEYTFGNNFIWSKPYKMQIAFYKDFYLAESDGEYFYPAGRGDIKEVISLLKDCARERGENLRICSSPKGGMEYLKELYGDSVEIRSNADYFDYCYNREDLAYLIGKKYHSKRNFINRFMQNKWSYEEISKEISDKLGRGSTAINATGMYEKADRKILWCVVSKNEVAKIREIANNIDRNSFMSIFNAREVYGMGFKKI